MFVFPLPHRGYQLKGLWWVSRGAGSFQLAARGFRPEACSRAWRDPGRHRDHDGGARDGARSRHEGDHSHGPGRREGIGGMRNNGVSGIRPEDQSFSYSPRLKSGSSTLAIESAERMGRCVLV